MSLRPELGDFSSIVCFRALVLGTEEALGKRAAMVALKAAGRKRGEALVASLGLTGSAPSADTLARTLDAALGKDGTRLCAVDRCEQDGQTFRVDLSETVCSADEPMGSDRELTFTLGAVHGALEALYDVKLKSTQTGSVLRGATHDQITLEPR